MKNNLKEVRKNQDIKISLEDVRVMTHEMLEERIRLGALDYVNRVINEEVESLCGSPFSF